MSSLCLMLYNCKNDFVFCLIRVSGWSLLREARWTVFLSHQTQDV